MRKVRVKSKEEHAQSGAFDCSISDFPSGCSVM